MTHPARATGTATAIVRRPDRPQFTRAPSVALACAVTLTALAALAAARPARAAEPAAPAAATGAAVEPVLVRAVANFDFDRANLRAADRSTLLAEVGKMKNVTWQTVTAIGYTDSVGSSAYNEKLSAKRAAAVKAYLVSKGIDGSMVNAEAKAAAEPVAPNDSEEGRAKNRRTVVEFRGVKTAGN